MTLIIPVRPTYRTKFKWNTKEMKWRGHQKYLIIKPYKINRQLFNLILIYYELNILKLYQQKHFGWMTGLESIQKTITYYTFYSCFGSLY